jgi:hypothetical protein
MLHCHGPDEARSTSEDDAWMELTGEEPAHRLLALCTSGYERNPARATLTDRSLQTGGDSALTEC